VPAASETASGPMGVLVSGWQPTVVARNAVIRK
jgi:hypothetical protein